MPSIISVKNFSKQFDDNEVVSDLSFSVKEGEVFAFLGANGSGKTTTVRCLLGIMQPTSGELLINGNKFGQETAKILGYLPEERGLYVSQTVIETMSFFGELKGMSPQEAKKKSLSYLEAVDLADKAKTKIKKLSSGQQQKVQLGLTIINRPKLLILDEPTKGLDPVNRTLLMDMILELKEAGSTVIFITHQMEEVEKIADRLLMIKDGHRVLYGEVNDVKTSFGKNHIHLNFKGEFPANDELYAAKVENNSAEVVIRNNVKPQQVLNFLIQNNLEITRFEVASPSLHEIFVMISQDDAK